jgi:hypothetical protein
MKEMDLNDIGLDGRTNEGMNVGSAGLTELTRPRHSLRCQLCRERYGSGCVIYILAPELAHRFTISQADKAQPMSTRTTRETPPSRTSQQTTKSQAV